MISFDEITDDKEYPWFCNVHHRPAEYSRVRGWGKTGDRWTCPECNKIIEDDWHEMEGLFIGENNA